MVKAGKVESEDTKNVVKVPEAESERNKEGEEGRCRKHPDGLPVHSAEKKKREREETEVLFPLDPPIETPSPPGGREKDWEGGEHEKERMTDPDRILSGTAETAPSGIGEEIPFVESNRERWVETLVLLHREKEELECQIRTLAHDPPSRPTTLAASIQRQNTLQQEVERLTQTLKREDHGNGRTCMKVEGGETKTLVCMLPFSSQCPLQEKTIVHERDRDEEDDATNNPALFAVLVSKYQEARKRWANRKEYVQRLVDQMRSGSGAALSVSSNTLYQLYGVVSDEVAGVSWKESAVEWKIG